jgi:D-serine deaminase-like pyridoxal phosphate-dependent protein
MATNTERTYEQWRALLRGEALPAALVDLDALDANVDLLCAAMEGSRHTIRLATKSVRHPGLMRRIIERARGRVLGLMTYDAGEIELLASLGFDDFLMGYPVARAVDAERLARAAAAGVHVVGTVDCEAHVDLLAAAARDAGTELALCIDVDASWRPAGGRMHFGVRRSPIRDAASALALARRIRTTPGVRFEALLVYEAQIAGIRETNPGSRHLDPVRRLIKARSKPAVAHLRAEILGALGADGLTPAVVNGGGTGSIRWTRDDPSVTEVTVGSGFVCSHLFDGYDGLPLAPAAFFALPVARFSDPEYLTCSGGGYIASGAAGADRLPIAVSPPGLEPLPMEGWGEVQTPFKRGAATPALALGDPVIARHAKAGELAERFDEYLLVRGTEIVAREPTYRALLR